MEHLVIISSPDDATEDERLSNLAVFMGVSTEILRFDHGGASIRDLLNQVQSGPCGLAMHMATLARIQRSLNSGTTFQKLLDDRFSNILLYGVPADARINDALKSLTAGAIQAVTLQPAQPVRYSLPAESKDLCRQLAGQSLLTEQEQAAPAFEIHSGGADVETIMAANGLPMFVRLRSATGDLYLLASRIPDLRKALDRGTHVEDDCVPLLPPLIFLRHCFPQTCWRGNAAPSARLIIDDPLMAKRYGGLDIETLKTSMSRLGYGASIAFIPWNHWRSTRRSAVRFLSGNANLSICIHGCDHINHEFQLGSPSVLVQRAALGIRRMRKHQARVGAPFDDVMVFPQGRFSKASIPALRSANYLAAVNSTCFPTDYAPNDLTLGDLLLPAVTRFDGFPVFQRHYPRNLFAFSFDLFLGKPALIVEHHEYFRDRCKAMEEFVATLERIEPNLSWPGLSEQMMQTSMRRRREDGSTEIKFVTRRFRFAPRETDDGRHRLTKFEPNPDAIERVLVDAKSVPFGFENDNLTFELQAAPGQVKLIEVVDLAASAAPIRGFGLAHNTRVLLRRGLSEFRDGPLSRHKSLTNAATRVAKTLKTTGDL